MTDGDLIARGWYRLTSGRWLAPGYVEGDRIHADIRSAIAEAEARDALDLDRSIAAATGSGYLAPIECPDAPPEDFGA